MTSRKLSIPLREETNVEVEVDLDDLPPVGEMAGALLNERAPLDLWLKFAVT